MPLFGPAAGSFSSLTPKDAGGFARGRALMAERGWEGVELLPRGGEGRKIPKSERVAALMEHAAEMEYFITDTTPITRPFLEKARNLKLISMFGVGMDHIDLAAATENGIVVTRAANTNSRSVAEFGMGLLFALAKRIPLAQETLHQGVWRARRGEELYGKTLGVVGLGAIGSIVARLGKGIGMNVLASVRTPKPELAAEIGCEVLPLDELLALSDYVCLCLPGGEVILGEREFSLMKPGASLVNIARGSVVDEKAMIRALQDGRLGGAALDVFAAEPLPPESPLMAMPGVVATPHMASNSFEATDAVFLVCLEEVARRAAGERSERAVNPDAYTAGR